MSTDTLELDGPTVGQDRPTVGLGRPQVVLRAGSWSARASRRGLVVVGVLAAVVAVIAVLALCTGSYTLSVRQVVGALTGHETGIVRTIVVDWRLPRVLLTVIFGVALGLSGALFQSLTRNPLGSPDVIGFDTGAYTGALVVMLVLHANGLFPTAAGAVVGGLATAAVVYLLAYRGGLHGFRLVLVGIGVTAMLTSVNTWLLLRAATQQVVSASYWGAGNLDAATFTEVGPAAIVVAVLAVGVMASSRSMRALELGDDAGRQLGVRAERSRALLVVVGVGLSATVTALAGPIAFVALAAPQIAARLARSAGIPLAASAAAGAALLGGADWLAQHGPFAPLPVGVVTVVLGGGYFVWLLVTQGRTR